jgi:hypothetical protein
LHHRTAHAMLTHLSCCAVLGCTLLEHRGRAVPAEMQTG